jgi:hypothetical protein
VRAFCGVVEKRGKKGCVLYEKYILCFGNLADAKNSEEMFSFKSFGWCM